MHSEDPFAIHLEQQRGGSMGKLYALVVGHSHGTELRALAANSSNAIKPAVLASLGVKCPPGRFDFESRLVDQHYDAALLRSINLLDVRRGAPGESADPSIELDTPDGPFFGVRRAPSSATGTAVIDNEDEEQEEEEEEEEDLDAFFS